MKRFRSGIGISPGVIAGSLKSVSAVELKLVLWSTVERPVESECVLVAVLLFSPRKDIDTYFHNALGIVEDTAVLAAALSLPLPLMCELAEASLSLTVFSVVSNNLAKLSFFP